MLALLKINFKFK